jgi:hypothetical protein
MKHLRISIPMMLALFFCLNIARSQNKTSTDRYISAEFVNEFTGQVKPGNDSVYNHYIRFELDKLSTLSELTISSPKSSRTYKQDELTSTSSAISKFSDGKGYFLIKDSATNSDFVISAKDKTGTAQPVYYKKVNGELYDPVKLKDDQEKLKPKVDSSLYIKHYGIKVTDKKGNVIKIIEP